MTPTNLTVDQGQDPDQGHLSRENTATNAESIPGHLMTHERDATDRSPIHLNLEVEDSFSLPLGILRTKSKT